MIILSFVSLSFPIFTANQQDSYVILLRYKLKMEESIISAVGTNFKQALVCRICLSRGEQMEPLFVGGSSIIERIEYCTGLRLPPEPNLPSHICPSCVSHLHIAHTFKSTCLATQCSLQTHTYPDTTNTVQSLTFSSPMSVKIERLSDGDGPGDSDWREEAKKSKRARVKRETEDSIPDEKPPKEYKRGPYKKAPRRRPKFKFRRLWCSACQLQFHSKAESDAHRRAVHPDQEPENWMCEICGKVFVHRGSHYTHMLSHGAPLHSCAHCDYSTPLRHDLVKHLRIHTGIKQYQCAVCARAFKTSSNLSSHTRRLHERARPHACPQCPRRFFDNSKLKRHVDSHQDIKRFECEVCHSCFTRRCYWKKHLEKQHGVIVPPQRPGRQKVNLFVGDLGSKKGQDGKVTANLAAIVGAVKESVE